MELVIGITENVTPESIDFLPEITYADLLAAIEDEGIEGPVDLLIIGKRVNSGKHSREVGGFMLHLEDVGELALYGRNTGMNEDTDTNEIIADLCNLPELPEKIVGFMIREL
jgi:hypothetical protein